MPGRPNDSERYQLIADASRALGADDAAQLYDQLAYVAAIFELLPLLIERLPADSELAETLRLVAPRTAASATRK